MITLIIILLSSLFAFYSIYKWQLSYWERRGIPGPPPSVFYGNFKDITNCHNPPIFQLNEWTKKYGSVYGMYEGLRKVLVISDIDMINEVFLKKFDYFYGRKLFVMAGPQDERRKRVHVFEAKGKRWKRLRAITNALFTNASLKRVVPIVLGTTDQLIAKMRRESDHGKKPVEIMKMSYLFTMGVISRLICGNQKSDLEREGLLESGKEIFDFNQDNTWFYMAAGIPYFQPMIRKAFYYISSFKDFPYKKMFADIETTVDDRIREKAEEFARGETPHAWRDFIDSFLDTRLDDEDETMNDKFAGNIDDFTIRRTLHREEIIAQIFIFIVAGFDTTANIFSAIMYDISGRDDVMARMLEDIEEHCADEITYDGINKMEYVECVIKESFRHHPFGGFAVSRQCEIKTTIGDIEIEPGTFIQADVIAVHMNKDLWGEDAEAYRPERFFEAVASTHALQWLPFGAGPRLCPGKRLAMLELKVALTQVLRNFVLKRGPLTESKIVHFGNLSPGPESVTLYLEERA